MLLHFDLKIPFCLGGRDHSWKVPLCPNVRRESKLDILKGKEPDDEHVTSVIQSVHFGFCFCFCRVSCKLKLYLFITIAVPKAEVIKLNASHNCKCNYLVLSYEQGLLQ